MNNPYQNLWVKSALFCCCCYWFLIACSSEFIILHDSIGYEHAGHLINTQGWLEYFRTGPNREPFYPFLISLSMKIGDFFSISFESILVLIQIFLLFLTQFITLKILNILKVNPIISAFTILYLGFSPALINSTFCLFSEIAVFPTVPAIVLLSFYAIKSIQKPNASSSVSISLQTRFVFVSLGLILLLATLTKAVFEMIAPLILFLVGIISLTLTQKQNRKKVLHLLIITVLSFYIPLSGYKFLNFKYNGNFTVTDRGAWALYGNTERRMIPLTWNRFKAALSYTAGHGFCRSFFDENTCTEWSYVASDNYGTKQRKTLENQGLSTSDVNKKLIRLSVDKALENPAQYFLLWLVEGMKMLVWESLDMAYVILSNSLLNIYNIAFLKFGIFFLMPISILMSILTTTSLIIFNIKDKQSLFFHEDQNLMLSLILGLMVFYISFYAFFFILARYAFPLASLYLILTAFSLNWGIKKEKKAQALF